MKSEKLYETDEAQAVTSSSFSPEMLARFDATTLASFSGRLICQKDPEGSNGWSLRVFDIKGSGAKDFFGEDKINQATGVDLYEMLDPSLAHKHQERAFRMLDYGPSHRAWDKIFGMISRSFLLRSPCNGEMKELQMSLMPITSASRSDHYEFQVSWLDKEQEHQLRKEKENILSSMAAMTHDNRGLVTLLQETQNSLAANNEALAQHFSMLTSTSFPDKSTQEKEETNAQVQKILADNKELIFNLTAITQALSDQTKLSYRDLKDNAQQDVVESLKEKITKESQILKLSIFSNLRALGMDTRPLSFNFLGVNEIDETSHIDKKPLNALCSMLYNLCKNSFEAAATQVDVLYQERDGMLLAKVQDNGRGLPEELKNSFFSRVRIDQMQTSVIADNFLTKKRGEGTINATKLIEEIKGKCEVLTSESGAAFLISVPIIQQQRHVAAEDVEKLNDPHVKTKILLVEDSRVVMLSLISNVKNSLKKLDSDPHYNNIVLPKEYNKYGYAMLCYEGKNLIIVAAQDGDVASHLFQESQFDLVITDEQMPKKDGVNLIRDIRAISADCNILLMSADSKNMIANGEPFFLEMNAQYCDKTWDVDQKQRIIFDNVQKVFLARNNDVTEVLTPRSSISKRGSGDRLVDQNKVVQSGKIM